MNGSARDCDVEFTIAELRAIATRALAEGDDDSRQLLREQLETEEFAEGPRD
jgi:hypothetical protein